MFVDSVVINNVNCFGGSNASIDISVLGGTPFYSYLWSNGSTSEDVFSLSSGSYFVMLTDSNGRTTTSNTYVITEPTQIQNVAVVTPVSCFGGNDGSIDITTSGIPLYSYLWSNGDTTEDISGLSSGTYLIETTDNNGCSSIDSIFIMQPSVLSASLDSNNLRFVWYCWRYTSLYL